MSTAIVTRDSMIRSLNDPRPGFRVQYIGKALVAIFNRQTEDEQRTNDTKVHNTIGFSGSDAKSGSITAKYFIKHKTLEQWMVDKWMKNYKGHPRITKYHRQLNEIALEKRRKQQV